MRRPSNASCVAELGNSLYCAPRQFKLREVEMGLAGFIAQAREKNGLSFRDLEKRAGDLNHAYIWRLEKGDRDTPSASTIEKLSQALLLDEREKQVFALLVKTPIDDVLYGLMLSRRDIPWDDFEPVATTSFRGKRPTTEADWIRLIEMFREL